MRDNSAVAMQGNAFASIPRSQFNATPHANREQIHTDQGG